MRVRPAPSAPRTASSRSRPAARASSRFATLAAAISSKNPTAPRRTYRICRTSPTIASCSGIAYSFPAPGGGYCRLIVALTASRFARIVSSVVPFLSRAIPHV